MKYLRYARFAPLKLVAAGALLLPACSYTPHGSSAGTPHPARRTQGSVPAAADEAALVRQARFEFDAPPLPSSPVIRRLPEPLELEMAPRPDLFRLPQVDAAAEKVELSRSSSSRGDDAPQASDSNSAAELKRLPSDEEAPPSHIPERLPPVVVEAEHVPSRLPAVDDFEEPSVAPKPPVVLAPKPHVAPAPAMIPAAPKAAKALVEPALIAAAETRPPVEPKARVEESPPPVEVPTRSAEVTQLPPVDVKAEAAAEQAAAQSRSAMTAIEQQAEAHVRQGISLAERGAVFSARAQCIQALKLLAQGHDLAEHTTTHSQALAAGLRALKEVDDFVPSGSRLDADLNVAALVAAHRTPVLKESCEGVSPTVAAQKYYTFAQEQLAAATGGEPVGSWALYVLGRMHGTPQASAALGAGGRSKALVMHQAALMVDSRNHMAANELGVLLARGGQWEEARRTLEHSVAQSRRVETLQNLSTVYANLGEQALAARSRQEADTMLAQHAGRAAVVAGDGSGVSWLDAKQFSQTAPANDLMTPSPGAPRSPATTPVPAGGESTANVENRSTKRR